MTPFLPILGQHFQGFFSRIWLIIGWQVCILGLLSAKCSYLLKPCFNYIFQVSILSISRKVMEGNDKLKSSKWEALRKNKKSQIWNKKALFEYFRFKFEKANFIYEINALEFIQLPKIEQNNNDNSNNKKMGIFGVFRYFWDRILKNYCHIWNQHPQICLIVEFLKKNQKCLNLGPKMSYLGISGVEFKKAIVIFEISFLTFVWLQNFRKKNKNA